MKKIYLCAFAIIVINRVSAQINFGVKAGLNRTSLNYSGSAINDLGVRSDFNAGHLLRFHYSPIFTCNQKSCIPVRGAGLLTLPSPR